MSGLLAHLAGVARSWQARPSAALRREARNAARDLLLTCGEPADKRAVQSVLNGYGIK